MSEPGCESQLLSVVVPCHNEEECLPLFSKAIVGVASELSETYDGMRVELVLVDDGSSDGTLAEMKRIGESMGGISVRKRRFWPVCAVRPAIWS